MVRDKLQNSYVTVTNKCDVSQESIRPTIQMLCDDKLWKIFDFYRLDAMKRRILGAWPTVPLIVRFFESRETKLMPKNVTVALSPGSPAGD